MPLSCSPSTNNPKLRFRALLTDEGVQSLELSRMHSERRKSLNIGIR
jgi:hypothetical protein